MCECKNCGQPTTAVGEVSSHGLSQGEALASLKRCLVLLHSGVKGIEEYIEYTRAVQLPFSNRPPYSIMNDLALSPLYDAYCAALDSYLALQGLFSESGTQLADKLLAGSEEELNAWLHASDPLHHSQGNLSAGSATG